MTSLYSCFLCQAQFTRAQPQGKSGLSIAGCFLPSWFCALEVGIPKEQSDKAIILTQSGDDMFLRTRWGFYVTAWLYLAILVIKTSLTSVHRFFSRRDNYRMALQPACLCRPQTEYAFEPAFVVTLLKREWSTMNSMTSRLQVIKPRTWWRVPENHFFNWFSFEVKCISENNS